jgi:hypothetical protein
MFLFCHSSLCEYLLLIFRHKKTKLRRKAILDTLHSLTNFGPQQIVWCMLCFLSFGGSFPPFMCYLFSYQVVGLVALWLLVAE